MKNLILIFIIISWFTSNAQEIPVYTPDKKEEVKPKVVPPTKPISLHKKKKNILND
ncbi:MAG: hypothetical protein IPQ19_09420 [Bacteroidetes bacterium]|jgi:biopolymer transport protein ExbD|nr:hypothetical protein [Bacteroidota bacterium]